MKVDTRFRSEAPEMMDDFSMEGEILRDALDKIAGINRLLGGNRVTIDGVNQLIKSQAKEKTIKIIDIGCGNGDMLRALAKYAQAKNIKMALLGIDANPFTISYAEKLSAPFDNICYQCSDIFDEQSAVSECDIAVCTLTLHHFKDDEIVKLLGKFKKVTRLGIVVNDLERSALAYRLFTALCWAFRLNHMSRVDGLTSILRGFKRADLLKYSKQLQLKNYSIKWKWAFRYQWIIKTI